MLTLRKILEKKCAVKGSRKMRKELSDILENKIDALPYCEKLSASNEFIIQLTRANLNREELTIVVYELLNTHKGWILNILLPACDKEDIDFDYREENSLNIFEQVCYEYDKLDENVLDIFLKNISDESIEGSLDTIYRFPDVLKQVAILLSQKRYKLLGR